MIRRMKLVNGGSGPILRFRYALPETSPGQPVVINYLGYYGVPTNDSDVLEVMATDVAALVAFICGRAYRWLDEQRPKRGVFADGGKGSTAVVYEQRYAILATTRWRARGLRSGFLEVSR